MAERGGTTRAALAITSLQNDRVKAIRALEMRKVRRETGLFVAEGASILMTARERGLRPETLIAGPDAYGNAVAGELMQWVLREGGDVLDVSAAVLEKLAAKDNPQALLGVFKQRWAAVPRPADVAADATWVLLEGVRDPGNLGTIIRTANATGVAGIILAGACCDAFSRECVRATMGSIFAVPVARLDAEDVTAFLAAWPGGSVATTLEASEDFRAGSYQNPVLLVMGSEGPGLTAATAQACKRRVKIPMMPGIDSLNLAIATALVLYQIQGHRLGR